MRTGSRYINRVVYVGGERVVVGGEDRERLDAAGSGSGSGFGCPNPKAKDAAAERLVLGANCVAAAEAVSRS